MCACDCVYMHMGAGLCIYVRERACVCVRVCVSIRVCEPTRPVGIYVHIEHRGRGGVCSL
jgi:hypothetical protein